MATGWGTRAHGIYDRAVALVAALAVALWITPASAQTAQTVADLLDGVSIPGLSDLPVSDIRLSGTSKSAKVTLRGKSARVAAFKVDGVSMGAFLPDNFSLSDVVPIPHGTPIDGISFKDIAFIYVPKGKAKKNIATSSFPPSVSKALSHAGSRVNLKEGLNLFGEADFASSGAVKKVLQTIGHNRFSIPLSGAFPANLLGHDLKTATKKIKSDLIAGLNLTLPLPKNLRIPGMPSMVSIKSAQIIIVGREEKGSPKIFAGVTGAIAVKIHNSEKTFNFGMLAAQPGKTFKAEITGDSKDKLSVNLIETMTLSNLSFVASKSGSKWKSHISADTTVHNNKVKLNLILGPGKGYSAQVISKGMTIAKLIGSQGLPGLDDVELDTIDIFPGRMWLHGTVKGVSTFMEVQKARSGKGHFIAAYLGKLSPAHVIPDTANSPLKDVEFSSLVALYSPEKQAAKLSNFRFTGNIAPWIKKSSSNPTIKPGLNIFGHMDIHPGGKMATLLKKVGVTEVKLPLSGGFSPKAFSKNSGAVKNAILDALDIDIKLPKLKIPEVDKFLAFNNGTLKVKGKTPAGKRGIDVAVSGDADVHVKNDKIAFNIDVNYDKSELTFMGSTTKKWTHPMGIHWLDLDGLTLDIDRKNDKYDIKIAAKTDVGSHSKLDVTVDVHEKNGKITDAFFELDGPLKLSEIPDIKDIPNANHFTIKTIKVSEHGIEAKTDFGGKKDLDVFLFHGSGWNLILRQDNFTITELVPALKKTPLKHIVLSEAAIVLSKDGLQGSLSSFSPIAQDALTDIYGKGAANIDVESGLSLIAAFEHKKSKGGLAKALARLGLSEERVIMTGDIGGMFGGPARLNVDVDLSAHTGAKRQPKWMKKTPGVTAVFSMIATESAGQFDIEIGIGADITANIHGTELGFTAKTALEFQDEKIDVKIVADMKDNKGWRHPFGIPGFTLYEVGFDLGIVEDGAIHLGFDGNIKVSGKKYAVTADADVLGVVPTDIAFVGSADQVDMFFVEEIAIAMMGSNFKIDLPAGILPTYTKVKFAFVTPGGSDPDLHIPGKNSPLQGEGFALQGKMNWLDHELGSMELAVSPTKGIKAAAKIDDLNLGPLHLKNNDFSMDIALPPAVPSLKIDSDIEFIGIKERFKVAFDKTGASFDAKAKFGPDFSLSTDLKLSGIDISAKHPSFRHADFAMDGSFKMDIGKFIAGPATTALNDVFNDLNNAFNAAEADITKAKKKVNGLTKSINIERAKVRKARAKAEARVQSAKNRVNSLKSAIDNEWKGYHHCHGWFSKWPCRIKYAIEIGGTKGAKDIADEALTLAKEMIAHFPVDLDPKVAELIAARDVARTALDLAQDVAKGANVLNKFMKKATDKLTKDLKNSININKASFSGDLKKVIENDSPVDLTLDAEFFGAKINDKFAFQIGHLEKDLVKDVEHVALLGLYALHNLVEKGISDIPGPLINKIKGAIAKKFDAANKANKERLKSYGFDSAKYNKTAELIQADYAAYSLKYMKAQLSKTPNPLDHDTSETFANELIEVGHTGLCLTNIGGLVKQHICANGADRQWSTRPASGAAGVKAGLGYKFIYQTKGGGCIAPEGSWKTVATKFGAFTFPAPQFKGDGKITVRGCVNTKEFYWKVLNHGDGWMQIANMATNQCLHFSNPSALLGAAQAEWKPCVGSANQVYRLASNITPVFHADNIALRNDQLGLCIGQAAANGDVAMTTCNKAARYDYMVDIRGDLKFINRATGKCLQPSGYAHGAKMIEVACTQLDYQWWEANNQPGGIIIKNAQTKLCTEPPFRYGYVPPTQVDCKDRHNAIFAPVRQESSGPTWKLVTPGTLPPMNQRFNTGLDLSLCAYDAGGSFVPGLVWTNTNRCVATFPIERVSNNESAGQYRLATSANGVVWRQNTGAKLHKTNIPTGGFGGTNPATIYTCKTPSKTSYKQDGTQRKKVITPASIGWTVDGKKCHKINFTGTINQGPADSFKILSRSDADYYELYVGDRRTKPMFKTK